MRILKKPVYNENKKISIAMICIGIVMLILTFVRLSISFGGKGGEFHAGFNAWSSILSILPLTWCICTVLQMKLNKIIFAKVPSYVFCAVVVFGYILYYIWAGQDNLLNNVFLLLVAVLAIYPHIIAVLTLEGRVYSRVFSIVFASILICVSVVAFILLSINFKTIDSNLFVLPFIYVELLLQLLLYDLKPIKKSINKNI